MTDANQCHSHAKECKPCDQNTTVVCHGGLESWPSYMWHLKAVNCYVASSNLTRHFCTKSSKWSWSMGSISSLLTCDSAMILLTLHQHLIMAISILITADNVVHIDNIRHCKSHLRPAYSALHASVSKLGWGCHYAQFLAACWWT